MKFYVHFTKGSGTFAGLGMGLSSQYIDIEDSILCPIEFTLPNDVYIHCSVVFDVEHNVETFQTLLKSIGVESYFNIPEGSRFEKSEWINQSISKYLTDIAQVVLRQTYIREISKWGTGAKFIESLAQTVCFTLKSAINAELLQLGVKVSDILLNYIKVLHEAVPQDTQFDLVWSTFPDCYIQSSIYEFRKGWMLAESREKVDKGIQCDELSPEEMEQMLRSTDWGL